MKNDKKSEIVYINGIRFKKENGYLVLDQIIQTYDSFHNYSQKQTLKSVKK